MARAGRRCTRTGAASLSPLLYIAIAIAVTHLGPAQCLHEEAQPAEGSIAASSSRQLLQVPPVDANCYAKNCNKEFVACRDDPMCWVGTSCAGACIRDPKKPEAWRACQANCLYRYGLGNPNITANNVCTSKNKCWLAPQIGAPRVCLPPKGGFAKVKVEQLRGRYNVLAGATKLLDCEPAQFHFGSPKASYFTYQTAPGYLKPKVFKLPPYKLTSHKFGFSTFAATLVGQPDVSQYLVLDATAGNKFVLLMYCGQGNNVIGGYVLGQESATSIPTAVRQRFAKKLQSSVWAAYYDLPLSAFCTVRPRKFP